MIEYLTNDRWKFISGYSGKMDLRYQIRDIFSIVMVTLKLSYLTAYCHSKYQSSPIRVAIHGLRELWMILKYALWAMFYQNYHPPAIIVIIGRPLPSTLNHIQNNLNCFS